MEHWPATGEELDRLMLIACTRILAGQEIRFNYEAGGRRGTYWGARHPVETRKWRHQLIKPTPPPACKEPAVHVDPSTALFSPPAAAAAGASSAASSQPPRPSSSLQPASSSSLQQNSRGGGGAAAGAAAAAAVATRRDHRFLPLSPSKLLPLGYRGGDDVDSRLSRVRPGTHGGASSSNTSWPPAAAADGDGDGDDEGDGEPEDAPFSSHAASSKRHNGATAGAGSHVLPWEGAAGGDVILAAVIGVVKGSAWLEACVRGKDGKARMWMLVASHLPGRTPSECQQRWVELNRRK